MSQDGEYVVSVKWFGQHVSGSPLTLPVTKDLSRQLAKLGLAPINSQQYIQVFFVLKRDEMETIYLEIKG